jgi:TorA maturation chaperone TorD
MTSHKPLWVVLSAVVVVGLLVGGPTLAAADWKTFATDVTINSAFQNALQRSPDDAELRRYRTRVIEDHWSQRDIEDDLRGRRDYWSHSDRESRSRSADWDRSRYGYRDDYEVDRMIRRAYQDILGRDPDPDGLRTYRSNVIDRNWSEKQVRDALRSSPEKKADDSGAADRIVKRAYNNVLGRDPDTAGLYQYRNQVERHGWDQHDVENALRNSPEFRARNQISEEEARAIVRRAYESVLGREPDAGSAGYVQRVMRDHWTERDVARELYNSAEYRSKR